MDSSVTQEERLILDSLRRFNDREALQLEHENLELFENDRRKYDESGRVVPQVLELRRRVRMASAKAGFYGMLVDKALGGGGHGQVTTFRVWESLYDTYGPGHELPYDSVAHWAYGPGPLLLGLTPRLRETVVPELMSGEKSICFGMSEPDAGSDAWMMKTKAVRDGDGWVINGAKQWITNSPYAEYALVFAVTDPTAVAARKGGISCFVLDTKTPGCDTSVIKLFGDIGSDHGIVSLSDVRVGQDQLVGELNQGFTLALTGVSHGRLYNAARSVGAAQWALKKAVEYSKDRVAFGGPIGENQGVSFLLAESAIEIYAAKRMGLHLAELLEKGEPAVKEMSMAKAFATEMCNRVYDRAMQVLGGMGLTNESHLHRGWEMSRIIRIADGTSEILRRTIAQRLFKGDLTF